MLIHFACSKGHRLTADPRHAGRRAKCPTCQESLAVPPARPAAITDSSVMRILGDAEPPPPMLHAQPSQYKRCPRCGASLARAAKVCDACQTYQVIVDYQRATFQTTERHQTE